MANLDVYPVILSGGSGTRLWPLSRKHYPKQFLKLTSDLTMLQETALRLRGFNAPIAVCNESHRFTLAEQLHQIGVNPSAIVLEPVARNTASAIALAAFQALEVNQNATLVVLAADHIVTDTPAFQSTVEHAIEVAQDDVIVTFGVVPNRAETGFGYIQAQCKGGLSLIKQFVEKPDKKTAQQYVESGDYYWNSGMFVFKAQTFLNELKTLNLAIYEAVELAHKHSQKDMDFVRIPEEYFSESPDISIDYAVMEKTVKGMVLPINVGWSDVGSFSALDEALTQGHSENTLSGDIYTLETNNCFISSQEQFVATIGVENLVVISTKDALLIASDDKVQDVKKIVQHLEGTNRTEHLMHREVHRPWGKYDTVDKGDRYKVKRITVKPGASISKQLHHHRAEHWVVVKGTALVELNEKETMLTENESVYIPVGAVHRLTNPGKVNLEIIEVQSGSYLGEDDIVRLEDDYRRE